MVVKEIRSGLEQDLKEPKIPADSELDQQILSHLTRVRESTLEKSKCHQMKKLQNLEDRRKFTMGISHLVDEPGLTGTQLKKWVVNLSKY